MQEPVVKKEFDLNKLYEGYRKLDTQTERLKTALLQSLNFNLGNGVDFSVIEDSEVKQDFCVSFTLSYMGKSYNIGYMYVRNFDAQNKQPNINFSNRFIQQMVETRKSFDDETIAINTDSDQEQVLGFLQRHRKVISKIRASIPNMHLYHKFEENKHIIEEFLKNMLRPMSNQVDNALNDCLTKYPAQSIWPLYVFSGAALIFLAMGITGAVFLNIIGNMENTTGFFSDMFLLTDIGTVIGLFVALACLVTIGILTHSAYQYSAMKDSITQELTLINGDKSALSAAAKQLLGASIDQESLITDESDSDYHLPVLTQSHSNLNSDSEVNAEKPENTNFQVSTN